MSANAIALSVREMKFPLAGRQAAKTHPHAKPQQIAAWEKSLGAPLRVLHFALTQCKRTRYITIGRQGRETESVVGECSSIISRHSNTTQIKRLSINIPSQCATSEYEEIGYIVNIFGFSKLIIN
jgi:hypothetical protein